jgi:parallel beta-helix repeat protein
MRTPSSEAASEVIYIKTDGSVEGTDRISSADNTTYVVTGDIDLPVVVERNTIIVNGSGFTIHGSGNQSDFLTGLDLTGVTNVTVENLNVKGFGQGIWLASTSGSKIIDSNISDCHFGIGLYGDCNDNILTDNYIYNCSESIYISTSSRVSITGNWLENCNNAIVFEYGLNDSMIIGNHVRNASYGVYNSPGAAGYGYNDVISSNVFTNCSTGIYLCGDADIRIESNRVESEMSGIVLYGCDDCSVNNNTIEGMQNPVIYSYGGIMISQSNGNRVFANNVTNYALGIFLSAHDYDVTNNTICDNVLQKNVYGLFIQESDTEGGPSVHDNSIFHNNFINNTYQAASNRELTIGHNSWDDGYHSGGNYWSDYDGTDSDHDGIGDTPYAIDANNIDRYPLMSLYIVPEFPSFLILPLFMIATLLAVIFYRKKRISTR